MFSHFVSHVCSMCCSSSLVWSHFLVPVSDPSLSHFIVLLSFSHFTITLNVSPHAFSLLHSFSLHHSFSPHHHVLPLSTVCCPSVPRFVFLHHLLCLSMKFCASLPRFYTHHQMFHPSTTFSLHPCAFLPTHFLFTSPSCCVFHPPMFVHPPFLVFHFHLPTMFTLPHPTMFSSFFPLFPPFLLCEIFVAYQVRFPFMYLL